MGGKNEDEKFTHKYNAFKTAIHLKFKMAPFFFFEPNLCVCVWYECDFLYSTDKLILLANVLSCFVHIHISFALFLPCLAFRVIFSLNLFTFICRWQNRISNERQLLWCVSSHFFLHSTLETISNRMRRLFYIFISFEI